MRWLCLLLVLMPSSVAAELRIGIYPCCSFIHQTNTDPIQKALAKKAIPLSILGSFRGLWEAQGVQDELEAAWERGAVPFMNLMALQPVRRLWKPENPHDWEAYSQIWQWAYQIKTWGEKGEGRHLYLAPYQEVNGPWTHYHDTGFHYIQAYRMTWYVFYLAGALPYTKFTFAPDAGAFKFEDYYPGTNVVDVVAFSSFTSCDGAQQTYEQIVGSVVKRMKVYHKPIIVAQTAACGISHKVREEWARMLFSKLDADGVNGVIWFNRPDVGPFDLTPDSWTRAVAPLDPRRVP